MMIIGDIGNTYTKICLLNSNYRITKRFVLPTKKINIALLKRKLNFIVKQKIFINKSLFCSVVPSQFLLIKSFMRKNLKSKCIELKNLNLNKVMKIKVNRKQVGSDRIANSIAVISKKKKLYYIRFWYSNYI